VLVLVLYPSTARASRRGAVHLHWYARLLERPDILRALRLSLTVATLSTLVATLLGTLLALGLSRRPFRGRRLIEGGLYLPIVTPEIVAGISLLILFVALRVPLGVGTVVVAHVAFTTPFVAVVVLARLRGMDRSLEEAALALGADEVTAFRRITLPLLAPGSLRGRCRLHPFPRRLRHHLLRGRPRIHHASRAGLLDGAAGGRAHHQRRECRPRGAHHRHHRAGFATGRNARRLRFADPACGV
jgi:ABC-type uncharacterized transport system permease subunit